MDPFLRRIVRVGFHRGLSGSQVWLALAVGALGIRTLRKLANPAPETLFRTELQTGDRFEIGTRRG